MKICLLGSAASGQLDEGMKNVAHHLGRELSKKHTVLSMDPRRYWSQYFWNQLRLLQPDIVHYASGPSLLSLILLKLVGLLFPHAQTIVSAVHPWFPWHSDLLIPMLKPSLVLVQSQAATDLFHRYGCQTHFLSNGVDSSKFKPVSQADRRVLRSELGIPHDRYIILHVGSVKEKRGLRALSAMQSRDQQVLIVGSPSTGHSPETLEALQQWGAWVWIRYFDNIEKLYGLADCYVFPTQDALSAIQIPLSVLEAMACNLPVVSSAFGGLPDIFEEGQGLIYAQSPENLAKAVLHVRNGQEPVRTRRKIMAIDWRNIASQLEDAYRTLIGSESGI